MNNLSIQRAVIAGLLGTIVMTVTAMAAPLMGMPEMNVPKMLSGVMSLPIITGWAAHFMIGIILAVLYAVVFYHKIPGPPVFKAMVFSLIPWLMAQLVIMPMMSALAGMPFSNGIFSGSFSMAIGSLLGHLMYGLALGITYNRGSETAGLKHSFAKPE